MSENSEYFWTNIEWDTDYSSIWAYQGEGATSSKFIAIQDAFKQNFGLELNFKNPAASSCTMDVDDDYMPYVTLSGSTGCILLISGLQPYSKLLMRKEGSDNTRLQEREADKNGIVELRSISVGAGSDATKYYFGEIGIATPIYSAYRFNGMGGPQTMSINEDDIEEYLVGDSGFEGERICLSNMQIQNKSLYGGHITNTIFYPVPDNVNVQDPTQFNEWTGFIDGNEVQQGRYWNFYSEIFCYDNFDDPNKPDIWVRSKNGNILYQIGDEEEKVIESPLGIAIVYIPPLSNNLVTQCPDQEGADKKKVSLEHAQSTPGKWLTHINFEVQTPSGFKSYVTAYYFNMTLGSYTYKPEYYLGNISQDGWSFDSSAPNFNKNGFSTLTEKNHFYKPIVDGLELTEDKLTCEIPSCAGSLIDAVTNNWYHSNDWIQKRSIYYLDRYATIAASINVTLKNVPSKSLYHPSGYNEGQIIPNGNSIVGWGAKNYFEAVEGGPKFMTDWGNALRTTGTLTQDVGVYGAYFDEKKFGVAWSNAMLYGKWTQTKVSKGFYRVVVWK